MIKGSTFFLLLFSINPYLSAGTNRFAADSATISKVNTQEWPQKHPMAIEEAVSLNQVSTFRYMRREQSTERSFDFAIRWSVRSIKPSEKISLQLEYLQTNRHEPQKLELHFPTLKSGSRWSRFTLKGDDYTKNGDVIAWKISVLRAGTVLTAKRSILWRDPTDSKSAVQP